MRTIEYTSQFKRDFKRVRKGPHRRALEADFASIIKALAMDQPLAAKHRDHALTGEWSDHRDCHIKPDLVLIYRKPAERVLPKAYRGGAGRSRKVDVPESGRGVHQWLTEPSRPKSRIGAQTSASGSSPCRGA